MKEAAIASDTIWLTQIYTDLNPSKLNDPMFADKLVRKYSTGTGGNGNMRVLQKRLQREYPDAIIRKPSSLKAAMAEL